MRPVKRRLLLALLAAVLLPVSGCQTLYTGLGIGNYWNEKRLRDRNAWAAKNAWNSRFECFTNQPHLRDFSKGFKAGYMDVADGGTGCVPIFPPREYWGWKYQSCEGQARVAAWFAGYPHGARAAEEDGIGNYYQVQTSANIQHQYAQHGLMDPAYQGMYPVPPDAVPNPYGLQPGVNMSGGAPIPGDFSLQSESPSDITVTVTDVESK
ncbi:MAG: hypothetical protein MUC43_01525 [Pirellula sp.]|jgi:hypothetical protein|nr:hypothetical protein [Pirellula sp.]